jgi:hypothetical protein
MTVVYWMHDESCASEIDTGYVGVTEDPHARLSDLRAKATVPKDSEQTILFKGTREQCLALERHLRPRPDIGWNRAAGGVAPSPRKHGFASLRHGADRFRDFWRDAA